ncbi:MAG TPA: pyridoxamine 5'-phosphate oxidase family protein [Acidimicrobiales bacterium]|nr:pyridoxamine 5'-phosphate oxidase family protein [Acidimicrobiales bacterium]
MRVRRGAHRAAYDRDTIHAVLDAAPLAHVGVVTDEGPVVIPMAFGRDDEVLYLHGAVANAALRAAVDRQVCVTVTVLDGLVVARAPFHNSMNYRSVVVRGVGRKVTGAEHERALRLVSDHVVATWDTGRATTTEELRRTLVVAVPLDEASAKVRSGGPVDDDEDLAGPHWAGVVPLHARWGAPEAAADLPAGIAVPAAIAALEGCDAATGGG